MITAPERKQYPIPDEGTYMLKISKITPKMQVATPYGPKDKILFTYDVLGTDNGEGQPRRVWKEFYMGFGRWEKPSQLRKFVEAVLGRKLTKEEFAAFDENQLLDQCIKAEIVHNVKESTGVVYANIDEFYKNRKNAEGLNDGLGIGKRLDDTGDDEVPF